jgi:acetoacetyl-CoA reductase
MARLAIVTGGTRGIGAAISKALKAEGHKVIANYAGNDEAAQRFGKETGIATMKWDVSSYEACAGQLEAIAKEHGPVEILVNNAGITRDAMFHKMTPQQWSEVINTNLNSLFNMTRPVWDGMRAQGFGRIVCISSVNGQKGQMGQVNYSAAKAGDMGFVKALAQEGAAKGITVNAVAPGYIGTEMVRAIAPEVLEKRILPLIPTGRLGEPEEVARCVVFLASDAAAFITGSTLTVNGGQYMACGSQLPSALGRPPSRPSRGSCRNDWMAGSSPAMREETQKAFLRRRSSAKTSASEALTRPRRERIALSCGRKNGLARRSAAMVTGSVRRPASTSAEASLARASRSGLSGSTVSAKRALASVYSWPQ